MFDRRSFLIRGALTTLAAGMAPRMAFARAATERRFVFIIQRGAADGLAMLMPVGDPAFAGLRAGTFADDIVTLTFVVKVHASRYQREGNDNSPSDISGSGGRKRFMTVPFLPACATISPSCS